MGVVCGGFAVATIHQNAMASIALGVAAHPHQIALGATPIAYDSNLAVFLRLYFKKTKYRLAAIAYITSGLRQWCASGRAVRHWRNPYRRSEQRRTLLRHWCATQTIQWRTYFGEYLLQFFLVQPSTESGDSGATWTGERALLTNTPWRGFRAEF